MLKTRFKVGDIIEIEKYWDQGDDKWLSGIVQITDYTPHYPNTINGMYSMELLNGNFSSIRHNSDVFDNLQYLVWLGNINDNKTLRLLYGK